MADRVDRRGLGVSAMRRARQSAASSSASSSTSSAAPSRAPAVSDVVVQHPDHGAGVPATGLLGMRCRRMKRKLPGSARSPRPEHPLRAAGHRPAAVPHPRLEPIQIDVAAFAGVWCCSPSASTSSSATRAARPGLCGFFAIGSYSFAHPGLRPVPTSTSRSGSCCSPRPSSPPLRRAARAPTLRLRGDYLAIVTLGFGEIVPRVFRNATVFTGGSTVSSARPAETAGGFGWSGNFGFNPIPYYYLILGVIILSLFLIQHLRNSRLGRAWMAIREDEWRPRRPASTPVTTKLLAFALGASFSGFAGLLRLQAFHRQPGVVSASSRSRGGAGHGGPPAGWAACEASSWARC